MPWFTQTHCWMFDEAVSWTALDAKVLNSPSSNEWFLPTPTPTPEWQLRNQVCTGWKHKPVFVMCIIINHTRTNLTRLSRTFNLIRAKPNVQQQQHFTKAWCGRQTSKWESMTNKNGPNFAPAVQTHIEPHSRRTKCPPHNSIIRRQVVAQMQTIAVARTHASHWNSTTSRTVVPHSEIV